MIHDAADHKYYVWSCEASGEYCARDDSTFKGKRRKRRKRRERRERRERRDASAHRPKRGSSNAAIATIRRIWSALRICSKWGEQIACIRL